MVIRDDSTVKVALKEAVDAEAWYADISTLSIQVSPQDSLLSQSTIPKMRVHLDHGEIVPDILTLKNDCLLGYSQRGMVLGEKPNNRCYVLR